MVRNKTITSLAAACLCLCAPTVFAEQAQQAAGNAPRRDKLPVAKVADAPAPNPQELRAAIRKGADFLLANQNKDGSWGSHRMTKGLNVICPYPEGPKSFRLASTALCVIGLLRSPYAHDPAIQAAVAHAAEYMVATAPTLKRGDVYTALSVWGHAYGLTAMSRLAQTVAPDSPEFERYKQTAAIHVKALDQLADVQGGWGYYTFEVFSKRPIGDPTSFLTATVLIAYRDAKTTFGLEPDERVAKRAVAALRKMRTPTGSYVYAMTHTFYPGRLINRHTGSLARTPAGDLALRLYAPESVSIQQLEDGLDRIWSRGGWLSLAVKKPIPHESFAQNAGYFFYYGYYYAARCLDAVDPAHKRRHAAHMAQDILPMQEQDGSWWDYPLYNYHPFYGTGYALYTLSQIDAVFGERQTPAATAQ